MTEFIHKSVLSNEVLYFLDCEDKKIVLDGTVGGGGHAKEILSRVPQEAKLIGLDKDSSALSKAKEVLMPFGKSVLLAKSDFRYFDSVLDKAGIESVDAMLFDLGVSSFHLDAASRGFSFQKEGPLDMRMNVDEDVPLRDVLNSITQQELERVIRDFGQERFAKRISKVITEHLKVSTIRTTTELAQIIREAIPGRRGKIDPATRTFQALRIFVNDELGALEEMLHKAPDFLSPGGRLVIISFHSLEDRIVKNTFKQFSKEGILNILTKKPITASEEEIAINPRARSAKLRAAEKV
ncbi:MAG: 16S rRNA (cytosine(1402)-N(4))-methyltransferase RsmH [Candidatus Omnitrophota bacterium]